MKPSGKPLKPENVLSETYQRCAAILDGGWRGEYGDLARCLGRSNKSGRIIGRFVRSYTLRHPKWDISSVVSKTTGKPAGYVEKSETKEELAVRLFNELSSRDKWDKEPHWKKLGVWRCPKCNNQVSDPERCGPFHGATLHCGGCDLELSRRTGGGQSDPFRFKLCVK